MITEDMVLVREYAATQSERAFATLAERYVGLVHSAAVRQVGDEHLAQEITQAVFIILSRKAKSLGPDTILSAWLYRTTRYAAADALRMQRRRLQREQEAYMQSTLANDQTEAAWTQLSPMLDDAMANLSECDRSAVLLRYFENKTAAEVADALKMTDSAAHKRVNRALEKLRKFFTRRGVTLSATVIAGAVAANSVQAAPVGLAVAATAAAAKGAATGSSTLTLVKGTLKLMAWTKAKMAVVVGTSLLLAMGTTGVITREIGLKWNPFSEKRAFILKGSFEDVFNGKQDISGSFTLRAYGLNALVDMAFENGYRQITGTDGQDTFTYNPIYGDKIMDTNWNGIATISHGRFPTNAHFFEQILWLVCVDDPELLSELPTLHLSNSFDQNYNPGELSLKITKSGTYPDLVKSFRWYAPGYGQALGTKNRYPLTLYPNGWLAAQVSVTETTNVGKLTLPTKINYVHYVMRFATNTSEFAKLKTTITGPEDVMPMETCSFSVISAQADGLLSSYIPQAWDKKIQVDDRRIQAVFMADSQKWLEGPKLFKNKHKPSR